jgi:hypothetical protein
MQFLNRLRSVALGLAVWLTAAGTARSATNSFGFAGVEIFPVDPFVSHLQAADFDGDGLKELVLVNNLRSKITLLYNQTGHKNPPAARRRGHTQSQRTAPGCAVPARFHSVGKAHHQPRF